MVHSSIRNVSTGTVSNAGGVSTSVVWRAELAAGPDEGTARSRWWAVGGVVAIGSLIGLAALGERATLVDVVAVLRGASWIWLLAVAAASIAALACIVAAHAMAQRAAGLPPSGRHIVRPSLRAHMLNLVTKSNGLAGLVAFTSDAKARRRSKGSTVAAYLLAGLAQQIGFAVVAAAAFAFMVVDGSMRAVDVVAGVVFVVYVSVNAAVIVVALRDRETLRRLTALPGRIIRRVRFRSRDSDPPDTRAADELFDAAQIMRRSPMAALRVVGPAVASDLALTVALWCSLRAAGAEVLPATALVAFGVSTLSGIVSFLPAGLGFVEVSSAAVLIASGVAPAQAAAAVALYRLAELWVPLALGVGVSTRARSRRWRGPVRAAAALGAILSGLAGLSAAASEDLGPPRLGREFGEILSADRYFAMVAAVSLCSVGVALWRGKRWGVPAFAVLGVLLVWLTPAGQHGLVVPPLAATAVVVVAGIKSFCVRSDVVRARGALRSLAVRQIAILAYGIGGLYLLDRAFRHHTTLVASVVDGTRLLFVLPPGTIEPASAHGRMFIESVRLVSLTSVITFLIVALVPLVRPRSSYDRDVARRIVHSYGSDGLAPFALDADKDVVVDEAGGGLVSYHLTGAVALGLGDPIGPPQGVEAAFVQFVQRCDANGWIAAFHQVGDARRDLFESHGFQFQYIGAEAIVPVQGFTLDGPHFKSLRSTVRKLERRGRRVEELQTPIDDHTMAQLRAVSDSWLQTGGHRERTFTLGQFSPEYLRSTRVLVVRADQTGEHGDDGGLCGDIEAFVNILPSYQSTNGNFDLMRHRAGSANGVMDLLVVSMIELFRRERLDGLDLGLSPLAEQPNGPGIDRAFLESVRRHGDRWFHFQGLYDYKNKWQPSWEPRYIAFRSAGELPQVLRAVRTAGELPDSTRPRERLLGVARRFPVTLGLGSLIIWLMLVTAIDRPLHDLLLHFFGLSWTDITRLQFWRLFSSSIIQAQPGIVKANFVLALTVLPIAEWRLGSRHTIVLFWLCDMLSALTVLLSVRILSAIGSDLGSSHLTTQDAGSSAALNGILGALLVLIRDPRRRVAAFVAVCAVHISLFVAYREIFDIQHLIAAAIGFGFASHWAKKPAGQPDS